MIFKTKIIDFSLFFLGSLPRRFQDRPKTTQDAPKTRQDAPRRPKTAFKTRQDTPKTPKDAPKTRPRHPQDAPKHPKTWEKRAPNSDPKLNPLQTSILERLAVDFGRFWDRFWKVLGSLLGGFEVEFEGPKRLENTQILDGIGVVQDCSRWPRMASGIQISTTVRRAQLASEASERSDQTRPFILKLSQ